MTDRFMLNITKCVVGIVFLLLLTLALELLTLLFFKNKKTLFRPVLIANVISNPILNLMLPAMYLACYKLSSNLTIYFQIAILVIMEILVILGEAYIIKFFIGESYKKCFKYSLILNLVSALLGLALPFLAIFLLFIF